MRSIVLALPVTIVLAFGANRSFAQEGNPISTVVYYKLDENASLTDVITDMRENLAPTFEVFKKEGIITSYVLHVNWIAFDKPEWDLALFVDFPNFSAYDEYDKRFREVEVQHHGTAEARREAVTKRFERLEIVAQKIFQVVDIAPTASRN